MLNFRLKNADIGTTAPKVRFVPLTLQGTLKSKVCFGLPADNRPKQSDDRSEPNEEILAFTKTDHFELPADLWRGRREGLLRAQSHLEPERSI